MLGSLRKYPYVFLVGLQSSLVYRWNFLIRGFFSCVSLAAVFVLWGAAYAGVDEIGGFTIRETITYFLVMLFLNYVIGAFDEDYRVSEEIRNGTINQFLLKPVNYYLYRLSAFFASRFISGLLILVPLAVAFPFLRGYLAMPDETWRWVLALPAVAMSALIQFTIAYCFGLLAFWFLEIQGFVILSLAVESLLNGELFPLDLLPAALFRISQFLPFYYQMYFPAAVISGRLDWAQACAGLAVQAVWVVALLLIAQTLWKTGLRKHTAVGG